MQGENGKGKTSLLKALSGVLPLTCGKLTHQVPFWYKGHGLACDPHLLVKECLIQEARRLNAMKNLEEVTKNLELYDLLDKRLSTLSQGQKQRFSFFRLFLQKRLLWILDEPFSFLDETWQETFKKYLKEHLQNEGSVVMALHPKSTAPLEGVTTYVKLT